MVPHAAGRMANRHIARVIRRAYTGDVTLRWSLVLALIAGCHRAPHGPAPANASDIVDGTLVPTELDRDVSPVTTASGADARHYYCTPTRAAKWNGQLVIYLVGPREDPATAHAFAERACGEGFATIAPAYKNERAIRDVCEGNADCYEGARREIVFGEDRSSYIAVDRSNGLLHRIDTLAARLAQAIPGVWGPIRDRLARRDFAFVTVAGFSQGSGHALILAHDFLFARVVMMSGVPDRAGPGPATWITRWRASDPKTPGARMFGINHAADPFLPAAELAESYAALGIPDATCDVTEDRPSGECHRFVVRTATCSSTVDAHVIPSLASFGADTAPCALGGPLRHLGPTWDYLLAPH